MFLGKDGHLTKDNKQSLAKIQVYCDRHGGSLEAVQVVTKGQKAGYPVAVGVAFLDSLGANEVVLQCDPEAA